jgi:hypothetical protein
MIQITDEQWKVAQADELKWHQENQWRADDWHFIGDSWSRMVEWGFGRDDFKSVIDAGAGPRLRSKYFRTYLTAIEPLAEEYLRSFTWCDLRSANGLYSKPLEEFIPNLHAEFLICINCLDHCRNFDKAIENISQYADKFFLSFDCGGTPTIGEPLVLDERISEETITKYGLKIDNKTKGKTFREGWALNYWLKR